MVLDENDEMGWVKIHRKLLRSGVWGNPVYLQVWLWCIIRANRIDRVVPFNGMDISLKRGEFITGRKKATLEMPISEQKYRSALKYLESTNRITIKPTNLFSIISVVNYGDYQDERKDLTSKVTNVLTNKQPTDNQRITTDKNYKKEENEKKINTIPFSKEKVQENTNAHQGEKSSFKEFFSKNPPESILRP